MLKSLALTIAAAALAACMETPPPRLLAVPFDWSKPTDTTLAPEVERDVLAQLGDEVPDMVRDVWGTPEAPVRWPLRTSLWFPGADGRAAAGHEWRSERPARTARDSARARFHVALAQAVGATAPSDEPHPREWREVGTELRARGDTVVAIVTIGAGRACDRGVTNATRMDYALLFLRDEHDRWARVVDVDPFFVRGGPPFAPSHVDRECSLPMRVRRAALRVPNQG